jgi:hypothetical protein
LGAILLLPVAASAGEYHVSAGAQLPGDGSPEKPFATISEAAAIAQPGDQITVHEGVYRERITPPRGGQSDDKRIVYRAAANESVVIKGSEPVGDWTPVEGSVWMATIPNSFFGQYNPYQDLIEGDWFDDKGRPHHTGEIYFDGKGMWEVDSLEQVIHPRPDTEVVDQEGSTWTWFCKCDDNNTYLYANFHSNNPNEHLVEINVRDSCFYPDAPGRNYITVRGFRMAHAATQWAAPTAEQIGLIGTHWSKGWIIEDNVISDSRCSGITLGKDRATGHNVWQNEPEKDGATHYNEVIIRALQIGWSRQNIGSHIVRNNTIFDCEQTGICGSLGGAFSRIENNHIFDIWRRRQFKGAEMAGIKIHAAIDMRIEGNRIHRTGRGLWLDWMAQGARVTRNVFYANTTDDLFLEVNHGPCLIDNNLLLSRVSVRDQSHSTALAHNLIAGRVESMTELNRVTPYHKPHSTELVRTRNITGGDSRLYNNLFIGTGQDEVVLARKGRLLSGHGSWMYTGLEFPPQARGNLYYHGAKPCAEESRPLVLPQADPDPRIIERDGKVYLHWTPGPELRRAETIPVTTKVLGPAAVADLPYENPDGSPLAVDVDLLGRARGDAHPTPGPLENPQPGEQEIWLAGFE